MKDTDAASWNTFCYLGRQFGCEVSSQVVLRCDQAGGVVHFDLQVGERVQERGVGHWDFI